jgi:hypothetical protein
VKILSYTLFITFGIIFVIKVNRVMIDRNLMNEQVNIFRNKNLYENIIIFQLKKRTKQLRTNGSGSQFHRRFYVQLLRFSILAYS